MFAVARWLIWALFVISWTLVLEFPVPDPGGLPGGEFLLTNKYILAKATHVSAYAVLTGMSAWVPIAGRYRFLMMFFLMGHAWGTEMLQEVLNQWCHRTGDLADIGYDVVGIIVGMTATWKWWAREAP
jgi:hypothetical protein